MKFLINHIKLRVKYFRELALAFFFSKKFLVNISLLFADFMKTYNHIPLNADLRKLSLEVDYLHMLHAIFFFFLFTYLFQLIRLFVSVFSVPDAINPTNRLFMIAFF